VLARCAPSGLRCQCLAAASNLRHCMPDHIRNGAIARLKSILARSESAKWKKKFEAGGIEMLETAASKSGQS
jgi:hypothetical protein